MENKYGEELKADGAEGPVLVGAATKARANLEGDAQPGGHFPSATDTAARRVEMAKFLPKFPSGAKIADIWANIRQFVWNWHKKSMVLLI